MRLNKYVRLMVRVQVTCGVSILGVPKSTSIRILSLPPEESHPNSIMCDACPIP